MLANASPWTDNPNYINSNLGYQTCVPEAFFTIKEVSSYLHLGVDSIVRHIKNKTLTCKKNNEGSFLVTRESVHRFVESLQSPTDEELDKYLLTYNEKNKGIHSVDSQSPTLKTVQAHDDHQSNEENDNPSLSSISGSDRELQNLTKAEPFIVNDCDNVRESNLTVDYVRSFFGNNIVIPEYPCLAIRGNKKSVVFSIKVKNTKPLKLIKLNRDTEITEEKISEVLNMYEVFLNRRNNNLPWDALSYLVPHGRIKINTLNELFSFGEQEIPNKKGILRRLKGKYLSGAKGNMELQFMCQQDISNNFLECYHTDRKKTDRGEFIKWFSSIYNRAEKSNRVETLNFPNLVAGLKRSRSKPKSAPELNTYIMILKKAFDMQYHELTFNLLLQESVCMRKTLTTTQEVDWISFTSLKTEIGAELHKNGSFGSYIHTPQLDPLLKEYLKHLSQLPGTTKTKDGNPRYLFESPNNQGKARNNFDGQFNNVREALIQEIKDTELPDNEKNEMIESVRQFTQHRIRALNSELFHSVGVTEGQKENAFNRSVSEVSTAYDNLSDKAQREFKAKKIDYIVRKHPEYKEVIDGLLVKWKK